MGRWLNITIPRSWVRTILLVLGGLFCLSLGLSIVGLQYLSRDLPSLASIQSIEPSVKSLIYAANGDTLREFYRENRTVVPLSRIPRSLQDAVIAIEDRRFYEHYGIDLRRIVKIIWINATSRHRPGASTLTQQLARNLFLTPEKTITRKLKEIILALQIEQTYTKDEILTMYLNQIYLGRGAYGVQAAARTFFGQNVQMEVFIVDAGSVRRDADFAAYFVEEVRQELESRYGVEGIYSRGLRVYTTLVPRYQRWMEDAAETHMVAEETLLVDSPMTRAMYDSLVLAEQRPEKMQYLQCAGLLQDVRTGAILAMMGGRSYSDYKWNIALQAPRQPGSIFKPFVYLTALQNGYTTATILMDTPFVYDTGVSLWRPKNFSGKFEGPVSVRYAISRSINTPTAKLFLDFGLAPVIDNARRLGIESDLPRVAALFLGAGELKLSEIVPAYATFANHGVWARPYLITRVESLEGEILEQTRIEQREVLDPALAYMMTNLLQTTCKSAKWRGFRKSGGGKTGTTNDCTNAWFCGFTPSYCAGVWVGFDNNISMGKRKTGARMALPIWANFMGKISDEVGEEPFVMPATIIRKTICCNSGMLATSSCDSLLTEIFLPDNYPQNLCDLHGGEILDFSGVDKDFETLDSGDGDFEEF
jgi:penicillin-binding protein 1A